jgi:DNA invertase Pin-like site-specific DNA recombinase
MGLVRPLAVYTRVSQQGSRDDAELLSHELQRARIAAYAEAHGYRLAADRFEDTDRSGTSMDRPRFNAALAGVLSGEYGGLVVSRLSRFARTVMGGLRAIQEIERAGGVFVSIDPPIDTATASGRFVLTVFLALYAMEAEAIGEGTRQVFDEKTEAGVLIATNAPAGYEFEVLGVTKRGKPIRGRLLANEHAPAVRAAFELKAAGGSWAEVAQLLTEAGVPTRSTVAWSKMAARALITNPAYMGTVRNGDREKLQAHEPIVAGWLWRKAQPRAGAAYSQGEGHLLGEGLVRCLVCGMGLAKSKNGQGRAMLRCPTPGRGHASISYAKAQEQIVAAAMAHLGVSLSALQLEDGGGDSLAAEEALAAARAELAEVEALRGSIAPASYAQAHSDALAALEAAEDARAAVDQGGEWWRQPYLVTIAEGNWLAFEALPLPEQRRLLQQQIARVILRPGAGSADERLRIEWKQEAAAAQLTGEEWTVLQFTERVGLAFKDVPQDAELSPEALEQLRQAALTDFKQGGGLRRRSLSGPATDTPATRSD